MIFKARAYAKTNLFLDVLGKRSDGYHNVDTIMQSVSIYDDISLSLADSGYNVYCSDNEITDDDNIALKAAKQFSQKFGYVGGANITINKNIPVAAGMGGGSSDAAAVIILMNIATGVNASLDELIEIAASIGADVPFFLIGGTARAQGTGEELTVVPSANLHMVFLKEYDKQSTASMYKILDSCDYVEHSNILDFISALEKKDNCEIISKIYNIFERCWDFSLLCKPFEPYLPDRIFLSGSGPTVCALFNSEEAACNCAYSLNQNGYSAFYAKTVDKGIEIV